MSAFSFTAPCITKEQEKKELAELTDAERQQIDNDLYGRCEMDAAENPRMIEDATAAFHQAVDSLPVEEKAVYLEALRKCSPEVIDIDCNPVRFLRAVDYDPEVSEAAPSLLVERSLRPFCSFPCLMSCVSLMSCCCCCCCCGW